MKRVLFFLAAGGLLAALAWQWTGPSQKKKRRRGSRGPVVVEAMPVKRGTIVSRAHFIGTLQPRYQYTVAPQIGGRLSQLKVQVGDKVKQKQLLAIIENYEVVQQVEQALAAVRVARAQLDEQQSRLTQARQAYRRTQLLSQKRLESQAVKEQRKSTYQVEAAKLRVMQAQLSQKRSELKAARVRLSYTRIYARWVSRPLSLARTRALMEAKETLPDPSKTKAPPRRRAKPKKKARPRARNKNNKRTKSKKRNNNNNSNHAFRVVGERFANEGALVQPNTPLMTLLDIRSVIAVIYATEKDYIQIRPGQRATATTYVYRKRRFYGKVVRIAPLLKESSRLARVEIEFPNMDLALKPGMFVRIQLELEKADQATLIPRQALIRHSDKDGVFRVDQAKGQVQFIPVRVGIQDKDFVQVLSPPINGQVVTMGYHLLRDKSKVLLLQDVKKEAKGQAKRKRRRGKRRRGRGGR